MINGLLYINHMFCIHPTVDRLHLHVTLQVVEYSHVHVSRCDGHVISVWSRDDGRACPSY